MDEEEDGGGILYKKEDELINSPAAFNTVRPLWFRLQDPGIRKSKRGKPIRRMEGVRLPVNEHVKKTHHFFLYFFLFIFPSPQEI